MRIYTRIEEAIINNQLATVKELIARRKHRNINSEVLRYASGNDYDEIVKYLVEFGGINPRVFCRMNHTVGSTTMEYLNSIVDDERYDRLKFA